MKTPLSLTVLAIAIVIPQAASAQQTPTQPPVRIEPIESGFAIAPDARFTTVNGDFAALTGVYGGWLTDQTLLVGGAAYWLANREHDFGMQYGGGLVRWVMGGHRRLGVGVGALVGVGDATLSRPYGELFGDAGDRLAGHGGRFGRIVDATFPVPISETFFITEPQVSAIWSITRWMRLDVGASYRVIGAADLLDDQLRGASGTIALQFGGR